MARRKVIVEIWTVKGSGSFPIDMLRYDSCFPANETEAHKVTRTFSHHEDWEIQVKRYRPADMRQGPHIERWRSFCCTTHDYFCEEML